MATRVGLGPVFAFEWLTGSRRWQGYAFRSFLVLLMLAVLAVVWWKSSVRQGLIATSQLQAEIGRDFYMATVFVLLAIVGLAAPAATAGTICLDKARGNLALMFTTDLSSTEIFLGKLAARMVPVLGLIACTTPVLALILSFGGIEPLGLAGAILVILACAVFGCTLAMVLSIWGKKTHEVLLTTYAVGLVFLLLAPIWSVFRSDVPLELQGVYQQVYAWLLLTNPIVLLIAPLEPVGGIGQVGLRTQLFFCCASILGSMLLMILGALQIRRVVVQQLGQGSRTRRRTRQSKSLEDAGWYRPITPIYESIRRIWDRVPSPSLESNPVLWREWHRRRPSRWTILIWGLYILLASGFTLRAIVGTITTGTTAMNEGSVVNGFQVLGGLLLLSVSACTSLAEERQRGSLDVLLTTPLSTRSIVMGKWWGSFRMVPLLAILPILMVTFAALERGAVLENSAFVAPVLIGLIVLSYGAWITSMGLFLATRVKKFGRAVGIAVACYLVVAVGSIPFFLVLFASPNDIEEHLCTMSPFYGVGYTTALLSGLTSSESELATQLIFVTLYSIAYSILAAIFLGLTLVTFNHDLGRMSEQRHPPTRSSTVMDKKDLS